MDAIGKYLQVIIALIFFFFINSTGCGAQSISGRVDYDSLRYERTIDFVYQIWYKNPISDRLEADTILCALYGNIDSILLVESATRETLGKSVNLKISSVDKYKVNVNFDKIYNAESHESGTVNKKFLYDCECEVLDSNGVRIASLGSMQNFYVFENFRRNNEYSDHLYLRLLKFQNQFVFIPVSKRFIFNFRWRGAITKNGDIVWYDRDFPETDFSYAQMIQHQIPFILQKLHGD